MPIEPAGDALNASIKVPLSMNRFRKKVNDLVTADPGEGAGGLYRILGFLSHPYGLAVSARAWLYGKGVLKSRRLPRPVVSIGNLTVGGTGKTPMTLYLARLLKARGYRVAVISRGYRGGLEKTGGVVSDGSRVLADAASAGDEPCLMANKLSGIPVVVGRDRFAAGMLAIKRFSPDVILLDDAFQHLGLRRDVDLVLLDSRQPLGNGRLLPGGTLREPLTALKRADAFILTRCSSREDGLVKRLPEGIDPRPVFYSAHRPHLLSPQSQSTAKKAPGAFGLVPGGPELVQGKAVLAFSGIARNDDFRSTLGRYPLALRDHLEYTDHHRYTAADLQAIQRRARDVSAQVLCTTEKDYVRLPPGAAWPIDLVVVGIDIHFWDDAFDSFILERLHDLQDG